MHHHLCQQHLRNYPNGSDMKKYTDLVGHTSDDASMDYMYITYSDDEHDDDYDYDNNADDNDIDQVKSAQIKSN